MQLSKKYPNTKFCVHTSCMHTCINHVVDNCFHIFIVTSQTITLCQILGVRLTSGQKLHNLIVFSGMLTPVEFML